jgi:hypothetical protein
MEEQAKQIRLRGQLAGWPAARIAAEIVGQLPEMLYLEAHRLATGWTREQLSMALDALYERDGLQAPRVSAAEICGWEHGRHRPNGERQDYLARLYKTRPDRLGFGQDHSRTAAPAEPMAAVEPAGGLAPAPLAPARAPLGRAYRALEAGSTVTISLDAAASAIPGGLTISVEREPAPPWRLESPRGLSRRAAIKLLGGLTAGGLAAADAGPSPLTQPIDRELVASLRVVTDEYASQRLTAGPAALLEPVRAHLGYLGSVLRGSGSPTDRYQLAEIVGETAVLAGMMCFHTHNLGEARSHFAHAREIAIEFEHRTLAAYSLIAESMLHLTTAFGRGERDSVVALKLLDRAARHSAHLPPPTRAWLAAQEAEVHATLQHSDQCHRALERARRSAEEARGAEPRWSLVPWSEATVDGYEGICRLLLNDAGAAVTVLERRMRGFEPTQPANWLIVQVDLGSAYVQSGELALGARVIADACESARRMGHALSLHRARMRRATMDRWKHEPAVRQLDELLSLA